MPVDTGRRGRRNEIGWFSPGERGVLLPHHLRVTRSLRRSLRRYRLSCNTQFESVMRHCADPARENGWITEEFVRAYVWLHELGWAHSIEVFEQDVLVGGLYGVACGNIFAGESMFAHSRDASKVALCALVSLMPVAAEWLIDAQWLTPHLASLGFVPQDRATYLATTRRLMPLDGFSFPVGDVGSPLD